MNLYISILVEPRAHVPAGAKADGEFACILGGIPGGETRGPWRADQLERIKTVVQHWYENSPQCTTPLHQQQRDAVLPLIERGDFGFLFNFNTFDEIDLNCFQNDTEKLYQELAEACLGTDMVATRFDSI